MAQDIQQLLHSGAINELKNFIAQQVNTKDGNSETALYKASSGLNLSNVKYLIRIGAKINMKTPGGFTPLHAAAQNGHLAILQCLIDHGAQIEAKTNCGITSLIFATYENKFDVVNCLINNGAHINNTDNCGLTPLGFAKDQSIAKLLIENGAQINRSSFSGQTPLHKAVERGFLEVVQCLIEHGAQINVKNNHETTALKIAVDKGFVEIVKYLIDHEAEINAKNNSEMTALHIAVNKGFVEIVKYLIDHEAEIDAKDNNGCTPLHFAAVNNPLEIVKLLVEKGASIDVSNHNNETPFYRAFRNNSEEISKYLMEKKREFENANPQETIISSRAPCIICFQPRNALYVLNPCGHTSLCEFCAIKLTEERYAKCPTCRKPVRNYIKLFFQVPEEEHRPKKEKLQSQNDVAVDIDLEHKFSCIVNKTCEETFKTTFDLEDHVIQFHSNAKLTREDANKLLLAQYKEESDRLKTFKNNCWLNQYVSPEKLAKAGFICAGRKDNVQCVFCAGILGDWEDDDDPMTEHRKEFPTCSFVKNQTGNQNMTLEHFVDNDDKTENHDVNEIKKESTIHAGFKDIHQDHQHEVWNHFYLNKPLKLVQCKHCSSIMKIFGNIMKSHLDTCDKVPQ